MSKEPRYDPYPDCAVSLRRTDNINPARRCVDVVRSENILCDFSGLLVAVLAPDILGAFFICKPNRAHCYVTTTLKCITPRRVYSSIAINDHNFIRLKSRRSGAFERGSRTTSPSSLREKTTQCHL